MRILLDVITSGCDYFWMWLLLWLFLDVITSGCDSFWMWLLLDVITSGCDSFWMWLLPDVITSGPGGWMWLLLDVTTSLTTSGCRYFWMRPLLWMWLFTSHLGLYILNVDTGVLDNALPWWITYLIVKLTGDSRYFSCENQWHHAAHSGLACS